MKKFLKRLVIKPQKKNPVSMKKKSKIKGALFGTAIGDALGVPVEFQSRDYLKENPVKDYLGYMFWNQAPGTFSDDSSMCFCTVESLCNAYDVVDISKKFLAWYQNGYWGAHNEVFDVGGTTYRSLNRILEGVSPFESGGSSAEENGNGSLMRIIPIAFILQNQNDVNRRYQIVKEVSAITHAHFRSVFSCFIYIEYALALLSNQTPIQAYETMQLLVKDYAAKQEFDKAELLLFDRILFNDIASFPEEEMLSSGYVIHALESALWCFLTTDNYAEATLKAVNLGGDTDTTAAITGALAGLYYGFEQIPTTWVNRLAKKNEIHQLCDNFIKSLYVKKK
jgi:ADP-ribosylglycohydrolase